MDNNIKKFDFTPLSGNEPVEVASSQIVYYNSKREAVEKKEDGCFARITEYDASGNVIREVWGSYIPEVEELESGKVR